MNSVGAKGSDGSERRVYQRQTEWHKLREGKTTALDKASDFDHVKIFASSRSYAWHFVGVN